LVGLKIEKISQEDTKENLNGTSQLMVYLLLKKGEKELYEEF
jgi:hypothetical protein